MKRRVIVQYEADDFACRELARWAVRRYKDAHGISDMHSPSGRMVCEPSDNGDCDVSEGSRAG